MLPHPLAMRLVLKHRHSIFPLGLFRPLLHLCFLLFFLVNTGGLCNVLFIQKTKGTFMVCQNIQSPSSWDD